MKLPFDEYSLKARVLPAFLVFLPGIFTLSAWVPLDKFSQFAILGISINSVLAVLMAEFIRDQGAEKEPDLWKSWGGKPSSQLLRHRNRDASPQKRNKWRKAIENVTATPLPSAASEKSSPDEADNSYDTAVSILKEITRDKDLDGLLLKENIGYGFRRNLWASKPVGVFTSLLSVLVCAGAIAFENWGNMPLSKWKVDLQAVGALLLSTFLLVWWVSRIKKDWVRKQAFKYAERLLDTALRLELGASVAKSPKAKRD